MKEKTAARFESLEPLEYHWLQDSDSIRFGNVVVTFHNPIVVESSQLTENISFASARSNFFVPETQELESSPKHSGLLDDINEIPETEQMAPPSPCKNSRGSASSSVLDVLTECHEASNDAKAMFSQNIFGATKQAAHEDISDDDTMDSLDLPKVVPKVPEARDGSITPDLDSDRDGSVTPDLILPETNTPPENSIKSEPQSSTKIPQSMIDTDDGETDDESDGKAKCNPSIFDPTQPFFAPPIRTRFQQKRQAEIKPKTVSLEDFDFTQDLEDEPPSTKKICFSLETQPFMPAIPRSATVGAKVVNRILMSSDEEDLVDEPVKVETEALPSQTASEPSTPEKRTDSSLGCDTGTPEFFPQLPSDSQFGSLLDMANASQASIDNSAVAIEDNLLPTNKAQDKENIWQSPRREVVANPKKPRRKIMKYDYSEDVAGPSNTVKAKKRPNKSCAILISNGTPNLNELCKNAIETLNGKIVQRVAEADLLLTQEKLMLTSKILASVCRRIPIVGSEYLEASLRAGGWLDPKIFIIYDAELEARKGVSLKTSILTTGPRIFENFSVLTTMHTNIPRDQLVEIIENAGGEYLGSLDQQPSKENVAVILNKNDKSEVKEITKKYIGILQIIDKSLARKVMLQKL